MNDLSDKPSSDEDSDLFAEDEVPNPSLQSVAEDADVPEQYEITTLETTTGAHDDWLHRGPFLFELDWHTYMHYTVRR